jgi:hypothetical protein
MAAINKAIIQLNARYDGTLRFVELSDLIVFEETEEINYAN